MKHYDTYFIDLDGTIYQGKNRIPAAATFIQRLKDHGKRILYLTNNSTRTPEEVAQVLTKDHQIPTDPKDVYTSALATADYVKSIARTGQERVNVIGEWGLQKALLDRGFYLTTYHPDFVVVGMDMNATYEDFATSVLNIQRGAKFIGTNPDTNLPNERGMLPGAGSLVALVHYATQAVEPIVVGKPHALIMEMALQYTGKQVDQVLMVGDNFHTDIQAGQAVGMDTLLVYTGVSKRSEVAKESQQPTYQINSLDEWDEENI
ncbi:TIGR01457 family HAD-type hydrolase [uncultured Limosilactobacillus sp.]|uniref:TIGR01457 family HAD-type hydrolase n=1 Tax=uncultured Limosilactobacillus sp. TaxID=2837629 RepID=UPI0025DECC07|nr:TIGR01457 family HAD-type hydrolase [uncultured Limosilactobacillus sp.]